MEFKTLPEVRTEIDRVDGEIRKLFIERMSLAEQVARIKAETDDSIYKPDRESIIIEKQSRDMDTHLVMEYKALVKRIMEVSRKYQYGRMLELKAAFPYPFTGEETVFSSLAMVREELYLCDFCSKDAVQTASDFASVGDLVLTGQADAGAGIIENIGAGVSNSLNNLLCDRHLYINLCHVIQENGTRKKAVLFTKNLNVLPEHNRLKLMFICQNKSGALGSILSMISDYGVNLTEIHSIPFSSGNDWNYRFFAELSLNLLEKESQALIYQLSCETQALQLLGSYRCIGDFEESEEI